MNDFINKIDLITRDIYVSGRYADEKVIDANARYYKAAVKSPTVARMVYRNTFNDCDTAFKQLVRDGQENIKEFTKRTAMATYNAKIATNYEPAKSALKKFGETVEKLYPHSWWIRTFSVDTDRVVLDKVKGKAGWFHKLKVGAFMKKNAITHFFK